MRAPGEAPGLMALEIAIDEMAEKLAIDPVEFRVLNDTQVDPEKPGRPFSQRQLVECLRTGADKFGWAKRSARPGQVRDGRWLVGMGVAAAFRNNLVMKSAARVRLERPGQIVVETDMTDIGTGSYTIIAQTAAEMMGVPLHRVEVRLGDSPSRSRPAPAASGAATAPRRASTPPASSCARRWRPSSASIPPRPIFRRRGEGRQQESAAVSGGRRRPVVAEDFMEYGDLAKTHQQSTFGGHFVEVGVDSPRPRSGCAGCWRSAPPAGSSTRSRPAAR
jgi:xanthine dehydrogenase YagR molybdenum-binding subunit